MNRNLVGSIYYDCLFLPDSLTSMAAIDLVGSYTSRCGLMTDAALVYSALVYAALRKSGLISNGCSGREIYLVYAIINSYANIFLWL